MAGNGINMEQLNMISSLMGNGFNMGGGENAVDAMAMMNRMERLNKLMGSNENSNGVKDKSEVNRDEGSNNKNFRDFKLADIMYAGLPFVDEPFRKNIFQITKIMEVQNILSRKEEDIILMAREKQGGDNSDNYQDNRLNMLNAIKPFLDTSSKNQIDMMMKVMSISTMVGNNDNDVDDGAKEEENKI